MLSFSSELGNFGLMAEARKKPLEQESPGSIPGGATTTPALA